MLPFRLIGGKPHHSLPQLPGLIRLPDPPPTFDLQGGQPAPAVAEGVDALEVAQVQR